MKRAVPRGREPVAAMTGEVPALIEARPSARHRDHRAGEVGPVAPDSGDGRQRAQRDGFHRRTDACAVPRLALSAHSATRARSALKAKA
jgi:hypothetical protein